MEFTYQELLEFSKMLEQYQSLEAFMKRHTKLSYVEFDYSIVHELTLFTIEPDLNFDILEAQIEMILKTLPAIKQIFAKPFIHLKEQDIILPVEAVRIINNNTIQHISSHSELWTDIKKNEIQPAKLLTRTYEDNYGIYENLIFCNVIDELLAFTRNYLRILRELFYTNQTIEINILERLNHLNYFLALGKLHTGYSRNFDTYYGVASKCLHKLLFILNTITPRLNRPVYKKNKNRTRQLKLHKTNILTMHRDYHQIYKLSKYFTKEHIGEQKAIQPVNLKGLEKDYFYYCLILLIFSVGHFNFTCDEEKPINFSRFFIIFEYKDWQLKLKSVKYLQRHVLSMEIKKDRSYHYLFLPSINKKDDFSDLKETITADEYIVCSPYENYGLELSMLSIESFRRIQQFLLKAMILTDLKKEDCPFCNHKLRINKENSLPDKPVYECLSCRTLIGYGYCPTAKKTYQYTKIAGLSKTKNMEEAWLRKRKKEAQMYFRNITDITEDLDIICPFCNKSHD